jgi:hypothetical protein
MNSGGNLQRTSARGFEPPFVEGKGAWGWLSPDTMRRVGAIDFRAKQFIRWFTLNFRTTALLAKEVREQQGRTRALGQLVETVSFSRQGINGNLPVVGAKRGLPQLVEMPIVKSKRRQRHSRVTRCA